MYKDYGKIAYAKVLELENRVKELKTALENSTVNLLSFDLTTPETRAVFNKKAYFLCKEDGNLVVSLEVKASVSSLIYYQAIVNGKIIKSSSFSGGELKLNFECGISKGDGLIQINISCAERFKIDNFHLSLSGKIKYFESERRVSYVNLNNESFVSYLNGQNAVLYRYETGFQLESHYQLGEVKDACIAGYVNDRLYMLFINLKNELKVLVYDPIEYFGEIYSLDVSGVTSVCGYPYLDGVKVVFTKKGEVCLGDYVVSTKFTYERTKRRGAKVTCDSNSIGAYVISDGFKASKLITQ